MQVLEVLVVYRPGEYRLSETMWHGPANAVRSANVITYTVTDAKFVGDKIIESCNFTDRNAYWRGEGMLVVELDFSFRALFHRSLSKAIKEAWLTIRTYKDRAPSDSVPAGHDYVI